MEVDFALFADAAETINGKLYMVGGAIDTLWSPTIPFRHPRISFVMRLLFSPAEVDRTHKVEIHVMTEDGKRIQTLGGDLSVPRNPNIPKGWKQAFLAVLNFTNLEFEKFGDYSFEIVTNNSSLKGVPLRVAQRVEVQS